MFRRRSPRSIPKSAFSSAWTQRIKDTLLGDRLMAMLSGAFGLLVAQQRNEIGLRTALGGDRGSVIGLVMREAGFLLMIGLIAERPWRFGGAYRPRSAIRPQTVRPAMLATAGAVLASVGMVADYAPGGLRIPPRSDASLARGIGILEQ